MKYSVGDKVVMKENATLNTKKGIAGKVVEIVKIIGDEYWIKPHGCLVAEMQIEGRKT